MKKHSINKLYWILLALALYLMALMGCSLEMGKRQCYDVAWTDCTVTVSDLTITSAGTDLGATVTLSAAETIEGTVLVDGEQRSFSAYATGICDTVRSKENVSGGVDVLFSYDESIVVRRQDFSLFAGEANVTAAGNTDGTFTLEVTVEDIGGAEAPPSDDDAQDDGSADEEDDGATDNTRVLSITLNASASEHTEQHCSNDD